MGYIYFIQPKSNKSKIYVGQTTREDTSRLVEHAEVAYGLRTGKFYGSEELIQEYSLSGINTYIIQNGGIPQEITDGFHQMWEPLKGDDTIDFAELIWTLWCQDHYNSGFTNRIPGGENGWQWKGGDVNLDPIIANFKTKLSADAIKVNLEKVKIKKELKIVKFNSYENIEVKLIQPYLYYLSRVIAKVIEQCILTGEPSFFQGVFHEKDGKTYTPFMSDLITSLSKSLGSNQIDTVYSNAMQEKISALIQERFTTYVGYMQKAIIEITGDTDMADQLKNLRLNLKREKVRHKMHQYAEVIIGRIIKRLRRGLEITAAKLLNRLTPTGEKDVTIKLNFNFPAELWESSLDIKDDFKPSWYKKALKLPKPLDIAMLNPPEVIDAYQEVSYKLFDKVMQDVKTPLQDLYSKGFALEGAQGEDNIHFTFIQDGIIYFRPNATLNDHTTRAITPSLYEKMHEVYLTLPAAEWIIKNHHWEAFYRPMVARWRKRHNGDPFTLLDRETGKDNANYYVYSVAPFTNQIYVAYKGMLIMNDDTLTYY